MFINCPHCRALVATDPVTDLPPPQCPRCAAPLRDVAAVPPPEARAAPAIELGYLLEVPAADADRGPLDAPTPSSLSAQIHHLVGDAATPPPAQSGFIPIAALLRPADAAAAVADGAGAHPLAATQAQPAKEPATAAPRLAPMAAATPSVAAPTASPSAPVPDGPVAAPSASPAAADATSRTPEPASILRGSPGDDIGESVGDGADDSAARATQVAAREAGAAPAAAAPDQPRAAAAPAAVPPPSFIRRRSLPGSGFDWKTSGALAALALLLALQLLLADRARLAADARWRPLLANVCGVLGCALPPWREPSAFTVLARDVRPHASRPGALRVTASFRNDARWPQPWPRLRLVLSDIDGRPVAARDFAPREYLGAAPEQAELASGQSASVAMDVAEPGARSVAFDFELH